MTKNIDFFSLLIIFFLSLVPLLIQAQTQERSISDTNFYVSYPQKITARFYFSQKYTAFTIRDPPATSSLSYRPNTTLNLGVGVTYHNLSLNLAYGFAFLNGDKEKGKSKYLDLQGHLYPQKWVIDYFGQFYKGYYLYPAGYLPGTSGKYYQRPDGKITLIGLAAYKVLNDKKFSYRAAFIQSEWQKKSAGSLLVGAQAYYGVMKADSAWVPAQVRNNYLQADISNIRFLNIGPGIGYAYTLVVLQHFFITGSLAANLNLSFLKEAGPLTENNKIDLSTGFLYKAAAGFNSSHWNFSVNWVGNGIQVSARYPSNKYLLRTGNYRLIVAKKLMPGPKLKKRLSVIERI